MGIRVVIAGVGAEFLILEGAQQQPEAAEAPDPGTGVVFSPEFDGINIVIIDGNFIPVGGVHGEGFIPAGHGDIADAQQNADHNEDCRHKDQRILGNGSIPGVAGEGGCA